AALLTTTLAAAGANSAAAFAQTAAQQTRYEPTQVQRPISEDSQIHQALVPSLPVQARDDGGQQIAAVGPAMRSLVNGFNSMWPTRGEITTYFGEVDRFSPRGHSGLDIAAPE